MENIVNENIALSLGRLGLLQKETALMLHPWQSHKFLQQLSYVDKDGKQPSERNLGFAVACAVGIALGVSRESFAG